jgi:hypothetical protein
MNEIEERKDVEDFEDFEDKKTKIKYNTVIATYTAQWAFPENYTAQQITEYFKNNVPKSLILDDWDFQED